MGWRKNYKEWDSKKNKGLTYPVQEISKERKEKEAKANEDRRKLWSEEKTLREKQ